MQSLIGRTQGKMAIIGNIMAKCGRRADGRTG